MDRFLLTLTQAANLDTRKAIALDILQAPDFNGVDEIAFSAYIGASQEMRKQIAFNILRGFDDAALLSFLSELLPHRAEQNEMFAEVAKRMSRKKRKPVRRKRIS